MPRSFRGTGLVVLAALVVLTPAAMTLPAAAAEPAAPAEPAASTVGVQGWGRMGYPVPGNDIQVFVDAHGRYAKDRVNRPATSWGTFRIQHRWTEPGKGPQFNWGDFTVDCVTVGGPVATVTGTLVDAGPVWKPFLHWGEDHKQPIRMGVSFYVAEKGKNGGGPSRIGLSGATQEDEPLLTPCMAPAPDAAVIAGGYRIHDNRLLK
ncbi:hypothetical protein [Streptomyces sp. NPDC049585]|uniref:hypothetical protein n=1 Tax=Streptomyces sp. NPDC049585 TaxID=3155154 RepID=UPI003428FDC7